MKVPPHYTDILIRERWQSISRPPGSPPPPLSRLGKFKLESTYLGLVERTTFQRRGGYWNLMGCHHLALFPSKARNNYFKGASFCIWKLLNKLENIELVQVGKRMRYGGKELSTIQRLGYRKKCLFEGKNVLLQVKQGIFGERRTPSERKIILEKYCYCTLNNQSKVERLGLYVL